MRNILGELLAEMTTYLSHHGGNIYRIYATVDDLQRVVIDLLVGIILKRADMRRYPAIGGVDTQCRLARLSVCALHGERLRAAENGR